MNFVAIETSTSAMENAEEEENTRRLRRKLLNYLIIILPAVIIFVEIMLAWRIGWSIPELAAARDLGDRSVSSSSYWAPTLITGWLLTLASAILLILLRPTRPTPTVSQQSSASWFQTPIFNQAIRTPRCPNAPRRNCEYCIVPRSKTHIAPHYHTNITCTSARRFVDTHEDRIEDDDSAHRYYDPRGRPLRRSRYRSRSPPPTPRDRHSSASSQDDRVRGRLRRRFVQEQPPPRQPDNSPATSEASNNDDSDDSVLSAPVQRRAQLELVNAVPRVQTPRRLQMMQDYEDWHLYENEGLAEIF